MQFSVTLRNNRLDQIETTLSTAPKLQLRTGSAPANCAAADSGTLLAEMTLPSDWMAAASNGSKALAGTWQVAASGSGTAGHFRIKDNGGTTCHVQGTVGQGTGELQLDNTNIAAGQVVTITGFTITDSNA